MMFNIKYETAVHVISHNRSSRAGPSPSHCSCQKPREVQPEHVTGDDIRLSCQQTTTAQLSVLPEVCTRLVAVHDPGGWEACAWRKLGVFI